MKQAGPVWLPVLPPSSALLELAGLLAVITLIDWALPSVDVASLEPSPYWIPVLLLSLQYGTVAGLLAAAVATIVYVLHGVPEQGIGENLFTYLLKIWALPILWIGVSLLVGQFRLRQIEAKQELRRQLEMANKERESLSGYASGLERRVERLGRQLSSERGATSGAMLDALAHLQSGSTGLEDAFAAAARQAFPAAALSVATVLPHGMDIVLKSGWPEGAYWRTQIAAGEPLYRAIVSDRRALSALTPGDDEALQGEGLAAHPIEVAGGGRVAGMIKIESADASLITQATIARLGVLARAIAEHIGEPRIVINNDETAAATAESGRGGKLMRAWRHLPWGKPQTSAAPSREDKTGKAGPSRV
jgi:hypothetical protein